VGHLEAEVGRHAQADRLTRRHLQFLHGGEQWPRQQRALEHPRAEHRELGGGQVGRGAAVVREPAELHERLEQRGDAGARRIERGADRGARQRALLADEQFQQGR
jgi:hypothetical protein